MKTEIVFLSDLESLLLKAIEDNNIEGVERTLCQISKWKDIGENPDLELNSFYVCIYFFNDTACSGSGHTPYASISGLIKEYKEKILLKEKRYLAAGEAITST